VRLVKKSFNRRQKNFNFFAISQIKGTVFTLPIACFDSLGLLTRRQMLVAVADEFPPGTLA
jgi:hypothetical protein